MTQIQSFPHTRGGEPVTRVLWRIGPRVFPTRVGVNLNTSGLSGLLFCFPHTRGGEPDDMGYILDEFNVFPTRVGVNRHWQRHLL